jgi:hypothetical protein
MNCHLARSLGLLLAVTLCAPPAWARIKLTTMPVRERVEIQLDHDSATLVEEQRVVPLVRGINQVDFSWANTQIDPSTIVFRVLPPPPEGDNAGPEAPEVNVLSVTYPPGENALVWQVSSSESTAVVVRISYLLGGLNKSFHYRAVAGHDEKTLTLRQYLRVQNFANETYGDTQIFAGFGERFLKPIGANQTKQLLMRKVEDVPIVKTYTADRHRFGYLDQPQNKLQVPMHYRLMNDADHGLGTDALPAGKVRIFQKDGPGDDATTAFLGEDLAAYTPVSQHADLFLGVAQDVVVKRTIENRDDRRIAGNLYDRHVTLKYEIENFKDQPVTLRLAEQIEPLRQELGWRTGQPAEWVVGPATTIDGEPVADETDQSRLIYTLDLPARPAEAEDTGKTVVLLEIVFKNQWN